MQFSFQAEPPQEPSQHFLCDDGTHMEKRHDYTIFWDKVFYCSICWKMKEPKQWTAGVRVYHDYHPLRAMQCKSIVTPQCQMSGEAALLIKEKCSSAKTETSRSTSNPNATSSLSIALGRKYGSDQITRSERSPVAKRPSRALRSLLRIRLQDHRSRHHHCRLHLPPHHSKYRYSPPQLNLYLFA